MCDPLTIGSAILSTASAAGSYIAQNRVASAREGVLAAERARQAQYDRETQALNDQSRERYTGIDDQLQGRANELATMFRGAQDGEGQPSQQAPAIVPGSSSNVVTSNSERARAVARGKTNQQADALGEVRSFGDLLGGINRLQARDAGYIGQINDFKKGSSGATAMELDNANHKGDMIQFISQIAGGLGKVGMSAGLSGNNSIANLFGRTAAPAVASPSVAQSIAAVGKGGNPFAIY